MPDQRDDEPGAPPFDPAHQNPLQRSGENPNTEPSPPADAHTEPDAVAPPDADAPSRSVEDTDSPEAVEPNEPA